MSSNKKKHLEISERKILLRIIDVFVVLLALQLLDNFFKFNYFNISKDNFYWTAVLAIYINVIGTVFEMYNLQIASNQFKIIKSIILTTLLVVVCYLFTPVLTPILPSNRLQILYFYCAILFSLLSWRLFYQSFLASHRFEKKAVIICDHTNLAELVKDLESMDPHFKVLAFVNVEQTSFEGQEIKEVQQISADNIANFVQINNVSEIIIAAQKTEHFTVNLYNQLLSLLESGFNIREYIQVFEDMTQRIPIHHFDKDFYKYFPFSRNNQNKLYLLWILIFDLFISVVGIICGIIILPLIIIGNFIGNKGPLFYTQIRVGQNGKPFKIYKFRTMVANAEVNGAVFSQKGDQRVKRFGRFLRKLRIDEIPQFLNIIKRDMSFIGPRPERPVFVDQLSKAIPFYDTRHFLKPGITGWAQVKYAYGESLDDSLIKLQYDLYYIKHRSFFLDLNIIIKTLSTVLFYRGQ